MSAVIRYGAVEITVTELSQLGAFTAQLDAAGTDYDIEFRTAR